MVTTSYEILRFVQRGTSLSDYQRLKAALDRLQSTSIATSIRQASGRRLHRFSWVNEWKERSDTRGRPQGLGLIVPDWFYSGVLERALVLTIDPKYFSLTGVIERWLYPLVRKHAGRQATGWRSDLCHLHIKSGARYGHPGRSRKCRLGDVLSISGPRNNFALDEHAVHSLLIAVGIGITPLLSMALQLEASARSFELLYFTRSIAQTAFHELLAAKRFSGKVVHFGRGRDALMSCLAERLRHRPRGAHMYAGHALSWSRSSALQRRTDHPKPCTSNTSRLRRACFPRRATSLP